MTATPVFLIDDHPLFRRGIAQLLEMTGEFCVVGEASSGSVGVEAILGLQADQRPDLILLDLNMKGLDGIETLRQFRNRDIDARILILTVSDNPDDLMNAIRAGADGYLLKDMEPEDILQGLRDAMFGQTVIGARLAGRLAAALRDESLASAREDADLTEREKQILAAVSQGKSNKLIARELAIAEGTVKVHMKSLLKKLKLHSRLEVAVWAMNRQEPKSTSRS
jgi:two-component system nitrate/nitrite response regulator NarL